MTMQPPNPAPTNLLQGLQSRGRHALALPVLVAALVSPGGPTGSQDRAPQIRCQAADAGVGRQSLALVQSLAQRGVARLKRWFPGTPLRPITFVVHSDASSVKEEHFRDLHPGVAGFARLQRDEIHLILREIKVDPPNDLRTTVDHELVHILLDQHVGENGVHVPRWLHEGLAQVLAGGLYLDIQEEQLASRVKARTYLPFASLRESFPAHDPDALALAYGQSNSFVAFLRREVGLEPLIAAARKCSAEDPYYRVVSREISRGLILLELEWCDYVVDSGSGYRVILRNCFMLTMVAAVGPLLALAVARRRNRDVAIKRRMAVEERAEDLCAQQEQRAEPGLDQEDPWGSGEPEDWAPDDEE